MIPPCLDWERLKFINQSSGKERMANRSTPNIRAFNAHLTAALIDAGLGHSHYSEITNTQWRDILQTVSQAMHGNLRVQFFKNTGEGGRIQITDDTVRNEKLTRFLKRTIDSEISHITVTVKPTRAGSAPWVSAVTPVRPPSGGNGDEGEGNNDQGEGQSEGEGTESDKRTDPTTAEAKEQEAKEAAEEAMKEKAEAEAEEQRATFTPKPDNQQETEFEKWWRMLAKLRKYCKESAEGGLPIDDFETYRPGIMGAAMIRQGITADACADAATAHWPEDAREELGITNINVADVIPPIEGHHPASGYLIRLMKARIPAMLHGGAGVGKTTLARDVAQIYGLEFGMLSMTAGLSPTALTGSVNLQGYVSRPCMDTFKEGGVFLFDEMDAADPNLLLICNTMLANGEFHSPITGDRMMRHSHWFPMAAVNTLNGASTAYTGRSRLDHATMDRWRMGRIRMDFNLGNALEYAMKELRDQDDQTVTT